MNVSTVGKTSGSVHVLMALRLAEEQACAGYLDARKALVRLSAQAVSLGRLTTEQPGRRDYRAAWSLARAASEDAAVRTELAYRAWQRATLSYDAVWTATEGCRRDGAA